MSKDLLAELRKQRDRLAADLEQLLASSESLRAQHKEEARIGVTAESELQAQERLFEEARSRSDGLRSRYQQLIAEERSLRERVEKLRAPHE
jgi:hypothetical protein